MPEEFEIDYMVYGACNSPLDEETIWRMDYKELMKWMMFKRFDNWVETEYYKKRKNAN